MKSWVEEQVGQAGVWAKAQIGIFHALATRYWLFSKRLKPGSFAIQPTAFPSPHGPPFSTVEWVSHSRLLKQALNIVGQVASKVNSPISSN